MNTPTVHSKILIPTTAVFVLAIASLSFADSFKGNRGYLSSSGSMVTDKDKPAVKDNLDSMDNSIVPLTKVDEDSLSQMQKQARLYRVQGVEYQKLGNLQSAMSLYQKAIQLDPAYAAAYNDLGVIYEAQGFIDRAEQSYLQALRIDPNFISSYSNLAMLYENERDIDKAGMCWAKRAQLGDPEDPWTQKARQRADDIRAVTSNRPLQDMREQEIVDLMTDVAVYKDILKKDNKALAASYMRKAKVKEQKGDLVTAYKLACDARQLDPENEKIVEFIDKLQIRSLSK